MYKLLKSRKGIGIDDFLPLMFALAVFILVLFFFMIGSSSDKKAMASESSGLKQNIYDQDNLLTLLQSPVNNFDVNLMVPEKPIILKDITVADLIILSYSNDDYKELEKAADSFLGPVYTDPGQDFWQTWKLKIRLMPQDQLLFEKTGYILQNKGGVQSILVADSMLPLNVPGSYLKVELFKFGRFEK